MNAEDDGVKTLVLADLFTADLIIEIAVADAFEVRVPAVDLEVLSRVPSGAEGEPQTVGIGNDGHKLRVVAHRILFVSYAAAYRPGVVELVVVADGEEPGVFPVVVVRF